MKEIERDNEVEGGKETDRERKREGIQRDECAAEREAQKSFLHLLLPIYHYLSTYMLTETICSVSQKRAMVHIL